MHIHALLRCICLALLVACLGCDRRSPTAQVAKPPAPQPVAAANSAETLREDVAEYIRNQVAGGFSTKDEIFEAVVEVYGEESPESVLSPLAREIMDQVMAEHAKDQASWPATTDCDRLDSAFAELERIGVVCRQNFTCCGTCGAAEIVEEIDKATAAGQAVRGYCFYHSQDTDSATSGGGLYLNYGSVAEGREAALLVAQQVVATLNRHGLKTRWNGTWETRIQITMNWQRRRQP